jgi:hypothetical protein
MAAELLSEACAARGAIVRQASGLGCGVEGLERLGGRVVVGGLGVVEPDAGLFKGNRSRSEGLRPLRPHLESGQHERRRAAQVADGREQTRQAGGGLVFAGVVYIEGLDRSVVDGGLQRHHGRGAVINLLFEGRAAQRTGQALVRIEVARQETANTFDEP